MAQAATFNDEIYRALRDGGMDEQHAMRAARAVPPADSIATKADLADLRAAMPDRENFAAGKDVAVLQTKVTTVEAAIIRIDETFVRIDEKFERIDETLASMKEIIARMDERINSTRTLLFAIFLPLHLLTLTAMFGLLTRGILWAVAP